MKLIDIVQQLHRRLPTLTDELTDTVGTSSVVHALGVATIQTVSDHGLDLGDTVYVEGAITDTPIASITHAVDAEVAVVTTSVDHDYTLYSTYLEGNLAVLSGADQPEYNGSFEIVSVRNRRVFHIKVEPGDPTTITGTINAENGSNLYRTLRGQYAVDSVNSATEFTVDTGDASISMGTLSGSIQIKTGPRIIGAISDEAAIASYSRRIESPGVSVAKPWIFVVLDDSTVSRGRGSRLDAVDVQSVSSAWQQFILQPFSLLLAIPAADQTLGRNARDTAEDLLRPILRSVGGKRFPTGLANDLSGPAQFVSHAFARYDGSVYWHEYNFEQRAEMTIDDTVGAGDSVAFRDIMLTLAPDVEAPQGDGQMVSDINLDEEPL